MFARTLPILTQLLIDSKRTKTDMFILYLIPLIKMLFFSNLIFILELAPRMSSLETSLPSRELLKLLLREEPIDESRMVTEALRIFPSGLKIAWRIQENYGGTSVDCQVSYCKAVMIQLSHVFLKLAFIQFIVSSLRTVFSLIVWTDFLRLS